MFNAVIGVTSLITGTVYLRPELVGKVEAISFGIKQ
jgi:hypothetical protein